MKHLLFGAALAASLLAGCGEDPPTGELALFPEDYRSTYQEVRGCRKSFDHDLMYIRVLASPDALTPYTDRTTPFPIGAILVKEQFPDSDPTCSGEVELYTVMQKASTTTGPSSWTWQEVGPNLRTLEETTDTRGCVGCHSNCGIPGYDSTCTEP